MIERELSMRSLDETACFMEARMLQPEIVAVESNPSVFYNYTHGNAAAATSLLTSYWSERRRLFGSMALAPLVNVSDGKPGETLTMEDLSALESGFVRSLPTDSSGRTMIFLNMTLQSEFPTEVLKRAVFFVLQSTLTDTSQSPHELVLVVLINDAFDATTNSEVLRWTCGIVTDTVPMNLQRLQVLKIGSDHSPGLLFSVIDQIVRQGHTKEVIYTAAKTSAELFERVKPYGISLSFLPSMRDEDCGLDPAVALRTSDSNMALTASSGLSSEDGILKGFITGSTGATTSSTSLEHVSVSSDDRKRNRKVLSRSSSQQHQLLDCNDEPSMERPRSRNAVYSRRKYLRKKIEHEVLETEYARLKNENTELKRESRRLEELWRVALELVEQHAADNAASSFPNHIPTAPHTSIRQSSVTSHESAASPFPQGIEQLPVRDRAALLAMRQANHTGRVSRFDDPVLGLGFFPMRQQQQQQQQQQGSYPFLLQHGHSLQYGMDHLRNPAMRMTLPSSLAEERMRLLFPHSYSQTSPLCWPSQDDDASAAARNTVMIGTRLGQQQHMEEDDIRRFLRDHGRDTNDRKGG